MSSFKTREAAPIRNPLEGRLLEGRGVEAPNLVDFCQDAIDKGSYTVLADLSPRGAIARLDLQDSSFIAAIALDGGSHKATIRLLHRADGHAADLVRKMGVAIFDAR